MTWRICPECKKSMTTVIDSRWFPPGGVKRRHACKSAECGHRFTTVELIVTEGNRAIDMLAPLRAARQEVMLDIVRYLKDKDVIDVDLDATPRQGLGH